MSIWPDLSLVTLSCTSRPLNCCEVPSRLSTSMVSWFTVSTDNRIWLTVPLISSTNKLCLKTTLQYIPCIQVNITIYTLYSRQHYNIYPVFKSTLQYIPCIQVNITIYTLYSSQHYNIYTVFKSTLLTSVNCNQIHTDPWINILFTYKWFVIF